MRTVVTCALLCCASAPSAYAGTTIVQFNGDLSNSGPGMMAFATAGAQANSSFGTATIGGQSAGVLNFAAAFGSGANRGLFLNTGSPPNGGGAYINQYTLMYDLRVGQNYNWCSLYQTSDANSNDGDAFIRPVADGGGIGISGQYHGTINGDTWYRIALVVNQSANTMDKYIDGSLVGTSALAGGTDGRWSLYSAGDSFFQGLYILADNDGDMTDGSINSFLFADRLYSGSEIQALGGATAAGIPAPATIPLVGFGVLAMRRRRR